VGNRPRLAVAPPYACTVSELARSPMRQRTVGTRPTSASEEVT
jgi:hypothetical protein